MCVCVCVWGGDGKNKVYGQKPSDGLPLLTEQPDKGEQNLNMM